MSNLTDVITRPGFNAQTLTVTRTAVGTTDGFGNYVPGATSTFAIVAGVQPVGSALKTLPEGYSADDGRRLYTTSKLVKLPTPDVVTIPDENGVLEDYAVSHVDGPWTGFGGTHYAVTVVRTSAPGRY